MMTIFRAATTTLGLAVFAAMFAPAASAGCGDLPAKKAASIGRPAWLMAVDNDNDPIVGMWKVQFVANGTTIDFGYSQWHGDGTEILNSGGRAPATGNFCLGVWKKTGHDAYKLTHYALSYDAVTGALNATVIIRENVTLDHSGNNYSGTFTFDIFDPSGAQVGQLGGTITGQRLTADQ